MASGYWRIGDDNTEKIYDSENGYVIYRTKAPQNILPVGENVYYIAEKTILLDFSYPEYYDSGDIAFGNAAHCFITSGSEYWNVPVTYFEAAGGYYTVTIKPFFPDEDYSKPPIAFNLTFGYTAK